MSEVPHAQTRAERRTALLEERHAERKLAHSAEHQARLRRRQRFGKAAFAVVSIVILGVGLYLAGGVFLGQRGSTTVAAATPMRISMSGFDPTEIHAKPGETVTLDWWNTDGAMHLTDGMHTLVSDTLGIRLELLAESRKTVTITAPTTAGDYDFWCDSCCGGKDNPAMHGKLHVEA